MLDLKDVLQIKQQLTKALDKENVGVSKLIQMIKELLGTLFQFKATPEALKVLMLI